MKNTMDNIKRSLTLKTQEKKLSKMNYREKKTKTDNITSFTVG